MFMGWLTINIRKLCPQYQLSKFIMDDNNNSSKVDASQSLDNRDAASKARDHRKPSTMAAREAAAGLNLAGNNPMSGRGGKTPTMAEREAAAGLNLAGNNPMSGREAAAGLNLAGNDTMSGRRRERRNKAKELKKKYNEIRSTLGSTAEKRELKEQYKAALLDIDTSLESNKSGAGSTIQDDSIDNVDSSADSSTDPLEAAYASQDFYLYAFKVIDDLDGTVSVLTGTVNTETATGLEPAGQPDELWLKVTFDTDGVVTEASVEESSGTTSATQDYRQIASITWDGDAPTIVQGIKGSQSIASCGATHQWGTLYS